MAPLPPKPLMGSQIGEARKLAESSVQSQYLVVIIILGAEWGGRTVGGGDLRLRAFVPTLISERFLVCGEVVPMPCQKMTLHR